MTNGIDWAAQSGDTWTRRWRETDRGLADLGAKLDSVLLDSELLDDRGAELSLLDSLDDDVDSFELAAGELVPHEAITRLTENRAAASTDFFPMNIRTPFGCTKRRVARSE